MNKNIQLYFIISWFIIVSAAFCQEKLVDIGTGIKFNPDSIAFSLSFSFNRTASSESEQGPYIIVHKGFTRNHVWALKPSFESNIGSGTTSSPDNIDLDLGFQYNMHLAKTSILLVNFAPTASCDKDFTTALMYPSLGIKYLYYYYGVSRQFRFYVLPGFNFDYGKRRTNSSMLPPFYRANLSLQIQTTLASCLDIGLNSQIYKIKNDTTVIADGTYGNMALSATYRFAKKFGLTTKYSLGYNQPLFKKINTLTIGLAWYR